MYTISSLKTVHTLSDASYRKNMNEPINLSTQLWNAILKQNTN